MRLSTSALTPSAPSSQDPAPNDQTVRAESRSLIVRNRRYEHVLSVEAYRLRDRETEIRPGQIGGLTAIANQIKPRLEGVHFSGEKPLLALSFLSQVVRVANQSHISEATLLWIIEDFLATPAKEAFRAQEHRTWPDAIQWLLLTYATGDQLDKAMRKLQIISQHQTETVRDFGLRLQLEASALGTLLDLAELKSLFSQGLRDSVRSLFIAHQPERESQTSTPLSVLISRAELLESGTRAPPSAPAYGYSKLKAAGTGSALALTGGSRLTGGLEDWTSRYVAAEESVEDDIAAGEILAVSRSGQATDKRDYTCFICYVRGHGLLECPLLSHLTLQDKEGIMLRRRRHLEQLRARTGQRRDAFSASTLKEGLTAPLPPTQVYQATGEEQGPKNGPRPPPAGASLIGRP
jgi:hypothetical protein